MELKDVILSTLSEIGEDLKSSKKEETDKKLASTQDLLRSTPVNRKVEESPSFKQDLSWQKSSGKDESLQDRSWIEEEYKFLESLRERLLVLFEGFQSPNNRSVESKIDLTLNFLEYLLVILDERIAKLKKL